jgi:hypothetical protein
VHAHIGREHLVEIGLEVIQLDGAYALLGTDAEPAFRMVGAIEQFGESIGRDVGRAGFAVLDGRQGR